jgi:hypothetical protein
MHGRTKLFICNVGFFASQSSYKEQILSKEWNIQKKNLVP